MIECLRRMRADDELSVPFVDWEVIPPFDGSAEDIFVWFICATRALKDGFRAECLDEATKRLRTKVVAEAFPHAAAETLRSDATSVEEIDAGGGRFHFFR